MCAGLLNFKSEGRRHRQILRASNIQNHVIIKTDLAVERRVDSELHVGVILNGVDQASVLQVVALRVSQLELHRLAVSIRAEEDVAEHDHFFLLIHKRFVHECKLCEGHAYRRELQCAIFNVAANNQVESFILHGLGARFI